MPDSGQEHTADGDDGFFMPAMGFDTAITICDLRMFLRFDQSICNMQQNWLKIRTSTGNPSGFDLGIALIVAGEHPAQETRCWSVGNTDMSPPISERI